MYVSKQELEAARIELSAIGFKAALRKLCRMNKGWDEQTAITHLAQYTRNVSEIFIQAKTRGVPSYMAGEVVKALRAGGVIFYKHQLRPTAEIIRKHAEVTKYQSSIG